MLQQAEPAHPEITAAAEDGKAGPGVQGELKAMEKSGTAAEEWSSSGRVEQRRREGREREVERDSRGGRWGGARFPGN